MNDSRTESASVIRQSEKQQIRYKIPKRKAIPLKKLSEGSLLILIFSKNSLNVWNKKIVEYSIAENSVDSYIKNIATAKPSNIRK